MFSEIQNNNYFKLILLLAKEYPQKTDYEEISKIIPDIDMNELFLYAKEHELNAVIYSNLKKAYKGELPIIWDEEYLLTKKRIEKMIKKLNEVADKLVEKDIPVIALKNGGISVAMLDDLAKSPMGDIDLLVNKKDFHAAHNILLSIGFQFEFRSDFEPEDINQAFIDGGTEYVFKGKDSQDIWFELSWRPISGRWIRQDREPEASKLIKNSILVNGSNVRILSPEDNLLQVAIHTAKHSYVREPGFRLHLDVERIVKHSNINWELFLKKVKEVGTKTAVYYSLYIPKQLFKTPIPKEVLDELKPSEIKDILIRNQLKKAKLLHPSTKKFSRLGFILFQIMLYDRIQDIFKVICPSSKWLKEKYNYKNPLLLPYYLFVRIFDLIGIRKKKFNYKKREKKC